MTGYHVEQLGGSFVVRDNNRGEVVCFRPSQVEAEAAIDRLNTRGTLAELAAEKTATPEEK